MSSNTLLILFLRSMMTANKTNNMRNQSDVALYIMNVNGERKLGKLQTLKNIARRIKNGFVSIPKLVDWDNDVYKHPTHDQMMNWTNGSELAYSGRTGGTR